jgi:hypothetical protein
MGFYLHIEVDSSLTPTEFHERVVVPLREALEKEGVGRVLDGDAGDDVPGDKYELALEVTNQQRAHEVVEAVLKSVEG